MLLVPVGMLGGWYQPNEIIFNNIYLVWHGSNVCFFCRFGFKTEEQSGGSKRRLDPMAIPTVPMDLQVQLGFHLQEREPCLQPSEVHFPRLGLQQVWLGPSGNLLTGLEVHWFLPNFQPASFPTLPMNLRPYQPTCPNLSPIVEKSPHILSCPTCGLHSCLPASTQQPWPPLVWVNLEANPPPPTQHPCHPSTPSSPVCLPTDPTLTSQPRSTPTCWGKVWPPWRATRVHHLQRRPEQGWTLLLNFASRLVSLKWSWSKTPRKSTQKLEKLFRIVNFSTRSDDEPRKTLVFIICLKFLRILWYLLIYYAK